MPEEKGKRFIARHEYEKRRRVNESEESREKRLAQQHLNREKKHANESSESRKKRLATQSQYQRQKIANESAECREKRLLNQHQYRNETRCIIVFTQAFCWKLTLFFVLAFAQVFMQLLVYPVTVFVWFT